MTLRLLLWIAFIVTVGSNTAYGYIDPGTGSIAIQLIFAAFASSYFWFGKVVRAMKRLFSSTRT